MIQTFDKETDTETIVSALNSDGSVIVANQVNHDLVNILAEISVSHLYNLRKARTYQYS